MKLQWTVFVFVMALIGVFALMPASVAVAQPDTNPFKNIRITGRTDQGHMFNGTLTIEQFVAPDDVLLAQGVLSGTLRRGMEERTVCNQSVTIPVTRIGPPDVSPSEGTTCPILHLELGPVDLNLLGLMVHLDRVVLDITAERGPGNLLGNLLCAIAHLLDGTDIPILDDIVAPLLNHLLRLFSLLR